MIISATFSKPTKLCQEKFNRPYLRIRVKLNTSSQSLKKYTVESFTEKQAFHSQLDESELNTGLNPISELMYGANVTRTLIHFDVSNIKKELDNIKASMGNKADKTELPKTWETLLIMLVT